MNFEVVFERIKEEFIEDIEVFKKVFFDFYCEVYGEEFLEIWMI